MNKILIQTTISKPIKDVWDFYHVEGHITNWNFATPEWSCPKAKNNFKVGGKFSYRMEARDGSMGFDFEGEYITIEVNSKIEYILEDGRKVWISFERVNNQKTTVVQEFEAEKTNPIEMQKAGWQAILDNFKTYCESQ